MMSARFDRTGWEDFGVGALCNAAETEEGVHLILDAAAISNLTKGDNIVFIRGDARDLVELSTAETEAWHCDGTRYLGTDGRSYRLFTASLQSLPVQVYIDGEVNLLLPTRSSGKEQRQ